MHTYEIYAIMHACFSLLHTAIMLAIYHAADRCCLRNVHIVQKYIFGALIMPWHTEWNQPWQLSHWSHFTCLPLGCLHNAWQPHTWCCSLASHSLLKTYALHFGARVLTTWSGWPIATASAFYKCKPMFRFNCYKLSFQMLYIFTYWSVSIYSTAQLLQDITDSA